MAHGRTRCSAGSLALAMALVSGVLTAEPAAAQDLGRGKALFTGAAPMRNGGAPCGACHAIGGQGPLLAASLGPELSRSFDGMPSEAIDGLLQDLPFPTMAPVYAGHALTAQERAHLAAFLSNASGAPAPTGNAVAGTSAAILAAFLALLAVRARRRKVPTRPTLIARPPAPARRPSIGRPLGDAEATHRTPRSALGGGR